MEQNQTPPNLPLLGEEQRTEDFSAPTLTQTLGETTSHSTLPEVGSLTVAYRAGPPSIGFYGRQWQREVAQPVTADEWEQMQARGDFDEFNFTEEK